MIILHCLLFLSACSLPANRGNGRNVQGFLILQQYMDLIVNVKACSGLIMVKDQRCAASSPCAARPGRPEEALSTPAPAGG